MKSFGRFIAEDQRQNTYQHIENPSNGYFDDRILKKVNAVMGKILEEDQIDSEVALIHVRNSLMKLGLSFGEYPPMTEEKGYFSLPLILFGGRFGKDTDTPHNEFLDDDGISHQREGGLKLNITYEMTDTNQCKLRAKIM